MSNFRTYNPNSLLGQLNEIETKFAPEQLFVIGDVEILTNGARVSVVGSRKASPAGLQRAKRLAKLLVQHGIVVVSGLAEGIDTAAHTSAIENGGHTIGVIGTPLDKFYPKQNETLQRTIAEKHLLISQFPTGHKTQRSSFPMRNRTMALIADATVIVEASDTSGSISQGWEALRLGRGLYITKAIAYNNALTWPKQMIHYGASILADDTLEEFLERLPLRNQAVLQNADSF